MPDRFSEPSLTIGKPGWTRRQVLKMLGSGRSGCSGAYERTRTGRKAGSVCRAEYTEILHSTAEWRKDSLPPVGPGQRPRCCSCIPVCLTHTCGIPLRLWSLPASE
jgi:hypothetical protein